MKKLAIFFLTAAFVLPFLWRPPVHAEESYRVIAHPQISADSIDKKKLSRMLLKEIKRWDDGTRVEPVDLVSQSPVRESFSKDVHGRSVASIKNFWQRKIFEGDDVPPPEFDSDGAVIAYVKSRPGSVGYVSSRAPVNGVKVLRIAQ